MLKQLLLAGGLLTATHAHTAEVSMNYVEAGTYLLIALSDTEEEYVFDAGLTWNECKVELRRFDTETAVGMLTDSGQIAPVKFIDVFCLMHDSGDF